MQACFELLVWGDFNLFVRIPAYQFSTVRIPNTNQQRLDDPAETARPSPNWQESEGATRANWDNSTNSLPFLSTKWRSAKTTDQQSAARLAMQECCHRLLSPTYILSPNIMFLPWVLPLQNTTWSLHQQNNTCNCITWHIQKLPLYFVHYSNIIQNSQKY